MNIDVDAIGLGHANGDREETRGTLMGTMVDGHRVGHSSGKDSEDGVVKEGNGAGKQAGDGADSDAGDQGQGYPDMSPSRFASGSAIEHGRQHSVEEEGHDAGTSVGQETVDRASGGDNMKENGQGSNGGVVGSSTGPPQVESAREKKVYRKRASLARDAKGRNPEDALAPLASRPRPIVKPRPKPEPKTKIKTKIAADPSVDNTTPRNYFEEIEYGGVSRLVEIIDLSQDTVSSSYYIVIMVY